MITPEQIKITWSPELSGGERWNDQVYDNIYDHMVGLCSFGYILMSWKSGQEYRSLNIDHFCRMDDPVCDAVYSDPQEAIECCLNRLAELTNQLLGYI
jgi:hypothetical protein